MMRRLPLGFLGLIVLVALNLRPALSSLAPVLLRLQSELGLSSAQVGALTTLPVLCLGVFAPLAPWLARRLGYELTLWLALVVLMLALALRAIPAVAVQFLATALVGAAIGVGGTVLPVLVKREISGAADLVTGLYTMALCLGGALGAGLSVPLADSLGSWSRALASWSLLALLAGMAWWCYRPRRDGLVASRDRNAGGPAVRLRGTALAWQVTVLMGSQSALAYIVFGWLPTLLQQRGVSEALAGWMLAVSVFVQLFAALGAPWLARYARDQRPALLTMLGMTGAGLTLLLVPDLKWGWLGVVALGIGQGGSFSLALTLLVLRSANPRVAAQLSGMAQGVGYSLAALGPLGVGVMLEFGVGPRGLWLAMMTVVLVSVTAGLLAGRNRSLDTDENGQVVTRVGSG